MSNDATTLTRQLAAVTALHQPSTDGPWCEGCGTTWPCQTARVLDQHKAAA